MDDKEKKEIQKLLGKQLAPFLVGIRNEIKDQFGKILKKELPDIIKTEITNPVKFPDVQKVEQTNPQKEITIKNFPKEVEVKDLLTFVTDLSEVLTAYQVQSSKTNSNDLRDIYKKIEELFSKTLSVNVKNKEEFAQPDIQKVEVTNQQKQQKQPEVQRTKIENSTPSEAIPVVLTDADKKRFYTAISQMITGGANLGNVKKLLSDILTALGSLTVNVGAVKIEDRDSTDKVAVEDDGGKFSMFVKSNSLSLEATQLLVKAVLDTIKTAIDTLNATDFATEVTLAAIKTQTDKLTFLLDRLKVDVQMQKASTGVNGAVTVGATATLIRAAKSDRVSLLATVNSNVTVFFCLSASVTTANGTPLKQDDVFKIDQTNLYTGDVYAIVASGTADVRFMEI